MTDLLIATLSRRRRLPFAIRACPPRVEPTWYLLDERADLPPYPGKLLLVSRLCPAHFQEPFPGDFSELGAGGQFREGFGFLWHVTVLVLRDGFCRGPFAVALY